MKTRVEIFARGDDLIGEGPWWSHEEQVLYWIDIGRKALHCRTLEGKATVWTLSIRPGCVAGAYRDTVVLRSPGFRAACRHRRGLAG